METGNYVVPTAGFEPTLLQTALSSVEKALKDVDMAIMSTPTGEARDHLTTANIELMTAQAHLQRMEQQRDH